MKVLFYLVKMIRGVKVLNKITFIGAGSMAEALIHGWITKNVVKPETITIMNRSNKERLQFFQQQYGIMPLLSLDQLHEASIVILAMKPKDVQEAMKAIKSSIHPNATVLSIVAGIPISSIEEGLGKRPIARAMPNTSATIGLSATGIAFNSLISEEVRAYFLELIEAIGIVSEVEEDQLHAITALSGSGPAYIYYLLEAFEKVGLEYGLSSDLVRSLMVQTLAGSAEMIKQVKEEPVVLRKKVTSPGGTTEAGIATLDRLEFFNCIASCIRSAEQRSRELAKGQ
jgi:pyrroline-5-carboxylate reductase